MINKHVYTSLATVIGLLTVFILFIIFVHLSVNFDELKETTFEQYHIENTLSTLDDNTYIGTYEVFPLSIDVEVVVTNHQIVDIVITEQSLFFSSEAIHIIEDVKNHQSIIDISFNDSYEASEKLLVLAIIDALTI